jgi:hypothetical protein
MRFAWFRKRKERRKWEAFMQALAVKGIATTEQELVDAMEHAMTPQIRVCLPEELHTLGPAELEGTDSGYMLSVSARLISWDGRLRSEEVPTVLALFYTAISEIAKAKGIADYVLKPGQRVALCEDEDMSFMPPHPLRSLGLEKAVSLFFARRR